MRNKKVQKLLKAVPSAVNHSEQLLIDVTTTLSKVGKKRSSRSVHVYRFVLLGTTVSDELQSELDVAISAQLQVSHLMEIYDNNEIEVCIVGVDFPDLEELDIRIAAAIGFFLGYAPEDFCCSSTMALAPRNCSRSARSTRYSSAKTNVRAFPHPSWPPSPDPKGL